MAVAVAQAYAASVAVHAAEEALQLHAGIGMTWEHPIHLYLKRAKADSIAYAPRAPTVPHWPNSWTSRPPDVHQEKPVPPGAGFFVRPARRR